MVLESQNDVGIGEWEGTRKPLPLSRLGEYFYVFCITREKALRFLVTLKAQLSAFAIVKILHLFSVRFGCGE